MLYQDPKLSHLKIILRTNQYFFRLTIRFFSSHLWFALQFLKLLETGANKISDGDEYENDFEDENGEDDNVEKSDADDGVEKG